MPESEIGTVPAAKEEECGMMVPVALIKRKTQKVKS
jgi:hypothetical protein